MNQVELKLPRQVIADPRGESVEKVLTKDLGLLWAESKIEISQIEFTPAFENSLLAALRFKKLMPGLEQIEKALDFEKKGLEELRKKQGKPSPNRISRLLIIANDGSERFYRSCESLVMKHGDRLKIVGVAVPSARMVQKLFGNDRSIKALLVTDRNMVSAVLLSLHE